MLEAVLEAQIGEQLGRPLDRLPARQPADHLRQDHVLERGKFRQQMMGLVDEADIGAADLGAVRVRHARGRHLVDIDLAPIGMLKQAGNMQQGGFAGARGRHQRDRLAGPDRELGAFEDFERGEALPVATVDRMQEDDGR
jgi:hypothetical protein